MDSNSHIVTMFEKAEALKDKIERDTGEPHVLVCRVLHPPKLGPIPLIEVRKVSEVAHHG